MGLARRPLCWNDGYWGPHVGFYGGVNYGFGYGGDGYAGGRWNNGVFAYNRTVNNFGGVHVTNVYNQTVIVNNNVTRVSFNGGSGGTTAQPTPQEQAAAHEQHIPPTTAQTQHQQTASTNRALLASENHGKPAIAATAKPNEFSGKGVVAAHEATPANAHTGRKPPAALASIRRSQDAGIQSKRCEDARRKAWNKSKRGKDAWQESKRAKTPGTNSAATTTLEKGKGPAAIRQTLKGGTPPKPLNTESKTLGGLRHRQNPLNRLQPHIATARRIRRRRNRIHCG